MIVVDRADYSETELLRPHTTSDGFLFVEGVAARPGVMIYREPDGREVRELVPRAVLASRADVGTLGGRPVTIEHPRGSGIVTPDSARADAVGAVLGDVTVTEAGYVRVKLALHRRDGIDAVKSGKIGLSPRYKAIVVDEPGEDPEFGRYDRVQIWRGDYNHLAIVQDPRGGSATTVRADSAHPGASMKPAIVALLLAAGLAADKADSVATEIEKIPHPDIEPLRRAAEAARADAKSARDAAAQPEPLAVRREWALDRLDLEAAAAVAKIDRADSLEDAALRRAVVEALVPAAKGRDDARIAAHWDVLREQRAAARQDSSGAEGARSALATSTSGGAARADAAGSAPALSPADALDAAIRAAAQPTA